MRGKVVEGGYKVIEDSLPLDYTTNFDERTPARFAIFIHPATQQNRRQEHVANVAVANANVPASSGPSSGSRARLRLHQLRLHRLRLHMLVRHRRHRR